MASIVLSPTIGGLVRELIWQVPPLNTGSVCRTAALFNIAVGERGSLWSGVTLLRAEQQSEGDGEG